MATLKVKPLSPGNTTARVSRQGSQEWLKNLATLPAIAEQV